MHREKHREPTGAMKIKQASWTSLLISVNFLAQPGKVLETDAFYGFVGPKVYLNLKPVEDEVMHLCSDLLANNSHVKTSSDRHLCTITPSIVGMPQPERKSFALSVKASSVRVLDEMRINHVAEFSRKSEERCTVVGHRLVWDDNRRLLRSSWKSHGGTRTNGRKSWWV